MKAKQLDRRSQRTRQLLSDAFLTLMLEKGYDQITVQDIIDCANVGRSTFYAHFQDKEDLLVSELEGLLNHLEQNISHENAPASPALPTAGLFGHVKENQRLYKAFALGPGIELLFRKMHLILSAAFEKYLAAIAGDGQQPTIPIPVLANYLAGSFLTLAKWWLDKDMPYSPERMDEVFQQLALSSARAALEEQGQLKP